MSIIFNFYTYIGFLNKIVHRDKKGRIIIDISPPQKGAMDLQKRIDDVTACFPFSIKIIIIIIITIIILIILLLLLLLLLFLIILIY
jgi:hypothetical protein